MKRSLILLSFLVSGALWAQDPAVYKERTLLEQEIKENEERGRFLADRQNRPYVQAEQRTGKYLTFDWSKVERPRELKEFKQIWHTPPIRQWWTNTCWCFAGTSFLESEAKRLMGHEMKLSEMYTVYFEYIEKAKEYVRTKGKSVFEEGGQVEGVLLRWKQYGIVPQVDYPGLGNNQKVYNHELLIDELHAYLGMVKKNGYWDEEVVVKSVRAILDKHLGVPPTHVTVEGKEYTPQEFLKNVLKLNCDDYVAILSLKHIPFWTKGIYPVPDNWWKSENYHNVPLEDFYTGMVKAVKAGHTIAIAGDVSEPGYDGTENCAIVPSFDVPQSAINQDSREFRFYNHTTEDDHGIHIVGHTQKGGRDWFLVKDSSRTSQRGVPGYLFFRDDYVKLKMLTYVVHRDAVKDLLVKFK